MAGTDKRRHGRWRQRRAARSRLSGAWREGPSADGSAADGPSHGQGRRSPGRRSRFQRALEEAAGRVRRPAANADLWFGLCRLVLEDRSSSKLVKKERIRILRLVCEELGRLGYRGMAVDDLRARHVRAVVALWKERRLSVNRMTKLLGHLRWWARATGREAVVRSRNAAYGIGSRRAIDTGFRGALDLERLLGRIPDERTRLSLALQWEFGLSPAESIGFELAWVEQGARVVVRPMGGGRRRARWIAVRWVSQRAVLGLVRETTGTGPLVRAGLSHAVQRERVYGPLARRAGIGRVHGLRWGYARRRYLEGVGVGCPVGGGPGYAGLDDAQRELARRVIHDVAMEMGAGHALVRETFLGFVDWWGPGVA